MYICMYALKNCIILCTGRYAQLVGRKSRTKIMDNASIPKSHPAVKVENRMRYSADVHRMVVEQKSALDQLGLQALLFIDRAGSSCLP